MRLPRPRLPAITSGNHAPWTRALLVAALGGALVVALPATALAKPHPHSSTTTTTSPGSSTQSHAVAKLVLQPSSVGHVSVERAGTSTFAPATNGESLHVGDTIQTDGVGLAEIDYATDSFTRLDVNTTFKITKLTDSQGDRQVNGTLETGQTWNRTVALTQSQSFDQEGAGTTAAVAGTAFVVDCTTPTTCTFTAVIDNVDLTGNAGQTQILNPLTQCVSTSGDLCATPSQLTPDQLALIQWIQLNVYLDFIEYGLGNGVFDPFGGTVTVTNGVVQTFTPSSPNQPFTPPTPPTVDPAEPVKPGGAYDNAEDDDGGCSAYDQDGPLAQGQSDYQPASDLSIGDDCAVDFMMTAAADGTRPFYIQFTNIDPQIGPSGLGTLTSNDPNHPGEVETEINYLPTDVFTFNANDISDDDVGTTSFAYEAVDQADQALVSATATVQVHVLDDCDDAHPDPSFTCPAPYDVSSTSTGTASASTTPTTAAAGTTPPTTTAPTTTSTTSPSGPPPTS